MAEKKNTFQIVLMSIFGAAMLTAVIMFAVNKGSGSNAEVSVTLWGTFSKNSFSEPLNVFNDDSKSTGAKVTYVEKSPLTYEQDLVEALASGTGPDIFFINQDMIIPFGNKIRPLPYTSFPERDFKLRYIDGASVFLGEGGVLAFPFAVDPLVMYYNKSMLNKAGIANPPKSWTQFSAMIPLLTQKDSNQNLIRSGLAFGQFSNIQYASNIFETLLLQLGNPIIAKRGNGDYLSVVAEPGYLSTDSFATSLQFFTNFSNPLLDTYSWNASLSSAEDMFVQDKLALYFAPASRFFDIQRGNINLNYDITKIPQVNETSNFLTSADFYGIAVSKGSKNSQAAFTAANILSNGPSNKLINVSNNLSSPRRDSLGVTDGLTTYQSAIRESALISYTWINPGRTSTEALFKEAVDSVVRGSADRFSATGLVHQKLNLLLEGFNSR